jgi:hypothetical protein
MMMTQGVIEGGTIERAGAKQTRVERYGVQICCVIMLLLGLLGGLLLKGAAMPQPWSSIADVRPPLPPEHALYSGAQMCLHILVTHTDSQYDHS